MKRNKNICITYNLMRDPITCEVMFTAFSRSILWHTRIQVKLIPLNVQWYNFWLININKYAKSRIKMLTHSSDRIILSICSYSLTIPILSKQVHRNIWNAYGVLEGSSWLGAFNNCCNFAAAGNEAKSNGAAPVVDWM